MLVALPIRSLVSKKEEAVATAAAAEVKEEKTKKPIDVTRRIRRQHHEIRQTMPVTPLTKQEHKVEVLHRPQNPAHHDESAHGDQPGQSHAASLPHPLHVNLPGEYDGPSVAASSLSMTDISQIGLRHMARASCGISARARSSVSSLSPAGAHSSLAFRSVSMCVVRAVPFSHHRRGVRRCHVLLRWIRIQPIQKVRLTKGRARRQAAALTAEGSAVSSLSRLSFHWCITLL